ncbi:Rhodocoxin reductase [Pseudonocardia autotrophica]|nr:Rhodocoxin reductase [Pseudonocardia autotrophica]
MTGSQGTGRVVVVGGGQAGFETAVSLRGKGFTGSITIIGDEPGVPYQRPPLSKAYLHPEGDPDPSEIVLRPESWFERNEIRLVQGVAASAIDRDAGEVVLADGERVPFEHLVLATGARNRPLPVPGSELPGVHYLRTLDEAHGLIAALGSCKDVAVVGAGFIGLEIAAAAVKKGAVVTVLEAAARPMGRAVSTPMSDHFTSLHRRSGVDLRLDTGVTRVVEKEGRAAGVETSDGSVVHADVVVVGIGVVPEVALAQAAGLPTANGVRVDARLRTTDSRIFAIGDCAAFPSPDGSRELRLESVQNAVDHARCVAAQLTGEDTGYSAVPWFWTEQFDSKLQMAGLVDGYETAVLRGDPSSGSFSVFCFSADGTLLAVESVNHTRDHMAARRLLAKESGLTPEQAADPATDLKALSRA